MFEYGGKIRVGSCVGTVTCAWMDSAAVKWSTQKTQGRPAAFHLLKYQQGMPYSKQKEWVKQWVSMSRSELLCFALLLHTSPSLIPSVAPVCLLQGGRNRKYSAAASCLLHRGLCVTRGRRLPTVTWVLICAQTASVAGTPPLRPLSLIHSQNRPVLLSKNSKVNVDMFPCCFSLFWSIVTKKKKKATKKHTWSYIFLALAKCQ